MPNSRNYMLTYFKLPEFYEKWLKKLSTIKHFRYVVGQLETTSTGRLHLQAYIEFNEKMSMSAIRDKCPGINVTPDWKYTFPNRNRARAYCMKNTDGSFSSEYDFKGHGGRVENTEFIEIGVWNKNGQGNRTDIDKIKTAIKSGKKFKKIIWEDCRNYQGIRMAEKLRQYYDRPRDPNKIQKVIWIYGSSGVGKTHYVNKNFKDIYHKNSTKWWDKYDYQETILIDDFRQNHCSFETFIKIIDRYPLIIEIKGGSIHINSPIIVITTPKHPLLTYTENNEDQQQITRRCTSILNADKKFSEEIHLECNNLWRKRIKTKPSRVLELLRKKNSSDDLAGTISDDSSEL